jgi:glycosyltransferase involved in cell wall biosynthesis
VNEGPSIARKYGVEMAAGDYIAFVDADDYIDENMYQVLLDIASKDDIDIIQCGYKKVKPTGELIEKYELIDETISGNYECAYYYAKQKNVTNFLWNKIYKAELFKNIVFPSFFAGEDSCILTQLYAKATKVRTIRTPFYNYVMSPESLCRSSFSIKKIDNVKAGKFMYNFYKNKFPDLSNFSALHVCSYAAQCYCELIKSDIKNRSILEQSLLNDFYTYYKLSKNSEAKRICSRNRVLLIELFKISPKLCAFLLNIKNIVTKLF